MATVEEADTEETKSSENKADGDLDKGFVWLRSITAEPVKFLVMFGMRCSEVIIQNFFVDYICRNKCKLPSDICENLSNHAEEEVDVEKQLEEYYVVYRSLAQSIVPAILVLILGPLSDHYGRRIPLLLALLGNTLCYVSYQILTLYPEADPAWLLLPSIPVALSGGWYSINLLSCAIVSDTSSAKTRSARISILQFSQAMGICSGYIVGDFVFRYFGYFAVFSISSSSHILALIYSFFRFSSPNSSKSSSSPTPSSPSLPDIVPTPVANIQSSLSSSSSSSSSSISLWTLLGTVMTSLKSTYSDLLMSCSLLPVGLLCLAFANFQFSKKTVSSVTYMLTRVMLGWDESSYSYYSVALVLVGSLGTCFVLPFLSLHLQVSDCVLGVMASISWVNYLLVTGLSTSNRSLYIGVGGGFLGFTSSVVIRSLLSKLGGRAGSLFSLVASLEAVMPLIASPVVAAIYNATVDIAPGIVFLVTAAVFSANILVFGVLGRIIPVKNK